jgi:hypothetical protein
MAGIERSAARDTLSSKEIAMDRQRVKSMLPGLNATFLVAGWRSPRSVQT